MFKTLREAGYDTRAAYEAISKGEVPGTVPGETLGDQKTRSEIEKTTAETAKAKAETAEITGESAKPLPPGFVKVRGKVYKDPSYSKPKILTGTDARILAQAKGLTSKLDKLNTMVGTPSEGYLPFGGGDSKVQEFQTLRDDIKSTLLYLRSGSAVTPQEYKRLAKLLPQLFRRSEVDKSQIKRIKDEFSIIVRELEAGKRGSPQPTAGGENSFDSEEEALAAGLPPGTEVIINGRRAVIDDEE